MESRREWESKERFVNYKTLKPIKDLNQLTISGLGELRSRGAFDWDSNATSKGDITWQS